MIFRGALRPLSGLVVLAFFFSGACGGSRRDAAPDPKTANETAPSSGAPAANATSPSEASNAATPASTLDALPPPDTDTGGKARHSLTMTDSRGTVAPSSNAIPSPPAKIDTPPQAGVEAAIKAVPSTIPVGNMSKSALEAPLRDRARFDHCRIPYGTHGEIAAVVYNGAALGVDVNTKPNDRALNFCMERAVRQMTWVKELAVNKVKVSF